MESNRAQNDLCQTATRVLEEQALRNGTKLLVAKRPVTQCRKQGCKEDACDHQPRRIPWQCAKPQKRSAAHFVYKDAAAGAHRNGTNERELYKVRSLLFCVRGNNGNVILQ